MASLLEVTAIGQSRRFRGGRHFTNVPSRIDPAALTEEQRAAIDGDPVLRVQAVEGELNEADASNGNLPPLTAEQDEEKIRAAISALGEDDYTQMGQPRMPAFREVLSNIERGDEIEADQLRMLQSFERMKLDDGFVPPIGAETEPSDGQGDGSEPPSD